MLCRQKYNRAKEMRETRSAAEVAVFFNVSEEYIQAMLPPKKAPAKKRRRASPKKVED